MNRIFICLVFFLSVSSISLLATTDSVSIDTIENYNGWGWEVLVVENNFITVGVIPSIGARVLQYDLGVDSFMITNPTLYGDLFHDPYGPSPWDGTWGYGGYKTWPAPQSNWNWQPPPTLAWGNYEYEVFQASKDSVTIWMKGETEVVRTPDLRFDRYITVYANSTRVKVTTVLFNDAASSQEWGIWDVTQVIVQHENQNDYSNFTCYFPVASPADYWGEGFSISEALPGIYQAKFIGATGKTFAITSEGWTCYADERDNQTYAKIFDIVEGADYSDDGAMVQFYSAGGNEYIEVEVLGPLINITANDSIVFIEDWYASQNSGSIYNANHAGMVTKKLVYHRPSKMIWGEYGVFHEGELHIKFLNSEGTEIGEGSSVSVTPDSLVLLFETVDPPASTASIELHAYNVHDFFIGCLDRIDISAEDSFIAYKASETPIIDGNATDACWDSVSWYPIDFVWLPYNDYIAPEDFTGKFKLSWTDDRLLLLVEIVDDVIYDIYSNPLDNYWNDDCVEVFLDEDHSGGNHQYNFNAFAYHVSTVFDVVDNGISGPQLFNSHIDAARNQLDSLYTWELSIKIFDDTYEDESSVPVTLIHGKEMGFSLAYCDNDASAYRENFIGSKYLSESESNDSYINASLFGTLTLIDPDAGPVEPESIIQIEDESVTLYPNPASEFIYYWFNEIPETVYTYSIIDLAGQIVCTGSLNKNTKSGIIDVSNLTQGTYVINFLSPMGIITKRISLF